MDEENDDMVICTVAEDNCEKVKEKKKKVSFVDVAKYNILHADQWSYSHQMSMMCTIDGELFYTFTKVT